MSREENSGCGSEIRIGSLHFQQGRFELEVSDYESYVIS